MIHIFVLFQFICSSSKVAAHVTAVQEFRMRAPVARTRVQIEEGYCGCISLTPRLMYGSVVPSRFYPQKRKSHTGAADV